MYEESKWTAPSNLDVRKPYFEAASNISARAIFRVL